MSRWLAAFAALLLASAVAAPVAAGASPAPRVKPKVTGGAPDGSAHPYVAMLLAPGSRKPTCTAVLVQADNGALVVLTDAHCVSDGRTRAGGGVGVTFAPTWTPSTPVDGATFFVDPLYNPSVSPLHDLAVVVVRPPTGVPATHLVGIGGSDPAGGTALTVVGTGEPHPGQRRAATEIVQGVTSDWVVLRPGTGNSCDGDSGGPDLIPGTSVILALTDQGTCSHDLDTPVGTFEAHWFVTRASTARVSTGVTQPSLLGFAATRHGRVVDVVGASRFLDIRTGAFRAWPGNQIEIQRWTHAGWSTIRMVMTDGNGNLVVPMYIPFRVGLRLVTLANTSTGGAVSVSLVL